MNFLNDFLWSVGVVVVITLFWIGFITIGVVVILGVDALKEKN
jgi:hypothetical protein